jgi:hypothetical protein
VAAGLPGIRPYDLRHSFASLLLAAGQSVIDVADQLGHAPTLTPDTYGHVMRELEGTRQAQTRPSRRPVSCPPHSPADCPTKTPLGVPSARPATAESGPPRERPQKSCQSNVSQNKIWSRLTGDEDSLKSCKSREAL